MDRGSPLPLSPPKIVSAGKWDARIPSLIVELEQAQPLQLEASIHLSTTALAAASTAPRAAKCFHDPAQRLEFPSARANSFSNCSTCAIGRPSEHGTGNHYPQVAACRLSVEHWFPFQNWIAVTESDTSGWVFRGALVRSLQGDYWFQQFQKK